MTTRQLHLEKVIQILAAGKPSVGMSRQEDWERVFTGFYDWHQADAAFDRFLDSRPNRKHAAAGDIDEATVHIERVQSEAEAIEERLRNGYYWDGGYLHDWSPDSDSRSQGRYIPDFSFTGLVSDGDPIAKLVVTKLPAGKKLSAGLAGNWTREGAAKLLGSDLPYVRPNLLMRGVVPVTMRGVFVPSELRAAIAKLGVSLPNKVVGASDEAGHIIDPDLWFLLHDSVGFGPKSHRRHRRRFLRILRALTKALRPLGATDYGLNPSATLKNPLSKHWVALTWADIPYQMSAPSKKYPLPSLAQGLDMEDPELDDELAGGAARVSRATPHQNETRREACTLVPGFFADKDFDGFSEAVMAHALKTARQFGVDSRQARETASKTAAWVWRNHRPELVRRNKSRKARPFAAFTAGLDSLRLRQGIGGGLASTKRKDGNIERMADVWMDNGGTKPHYADVMEQTGLKQTTVFKRVEEVAEVVAERLKAQAQSRFEAVMDESRKAPAEPFHSSVRYSAHALSSKEFASDNDQILEPTNHQGLSGSSPPSKPGRRRPSNDGLQQAA